MGPRLITPPAGLAVSMEAARQSARTSGSSLDAELELKIRALTEKVEHETGRVLIQQTWEAVLPGFPAEIQLPNSPLISVDHVRFYDVDGILRTLHPDDYQVNSKSEPGEVTPSPGLTWPATQRRKNAVEVQYVCGYGPTETSVPAAIKQYILGMISNDYYPSPAAQHLCRLLDRYWIYL